ncbi:hypothetical protein HOY82DRAFT_170731 [Tuber indicum]|nr:hypothetical protein HOY82DRAFT_170731 [Tuber indicum]
MRPFSQSPRFLLSFLFQAHVHTPALTGVLFFVFLFTLLTLRLAGGVLYSSTSMGTGAVGFFILFGSSEGELCTSMTNTGTVLFLFFLFQKLARLCLSHLLVS